MFELNQECFVVGTGPGLTPVSHGEIVDLMYKKLKSGKWFTMLFPWVAPIKVYKKIEETYYKPGSGRNAGFELVPMFDHNCILVFCYKPYMNEEQLSEICNGFSRNKESTLRIPNGRDFIIVTGEVESIMSLSGRMKLTRDLVDYYDKQETGT